MILKNQWEKFSRGDHLSDQEVKELKDEVEAALPFLQNHPDYKIAYQCAIQNYYRLKDMIYWRKQDKKV